MEYRLACFLARSFGLECFKELLKVEELKVTTLLTHKKDGKETRKEYKEFQEIARDNNIEIYNTEDDDVLEILNRREFDFLISVHSKVIFPKRVYERARIVAINVHPSIEENGRIKYRNGTCMNCIDRARNNEGYIGVSTHIIDEGIDTGEVLQTEIMQIDMNNSFNTIYNKLKPYYSKVLINTLESACLDWELMIESERDIKKDIKRRLLLGRGIQDD